MGWESKATLLLKRENPASYLVDCDETGNIAPRKIEAKISPRTRAIMVTHMWGIPCDMDEIHAVAAHHELLVFEDASHAHGAEYKGQKVGSLGDASVFSLQAQKSVTGGEDGVLLTKIDVIYYRSVLFGHYNRRSREDIPYDHELAKFAVTGMGLKLRIHPLAAAIAEVPLDYLDDVVAK